LWFSLPPQPSNDRVAARNEQGFRQTKYYRDEKRLRELVQELGNKSHQSKIGLGVLIYNSNENQWLLKNRTI
jgi:hypothetical protein